MQYRNKKKSHVKTCDTF